MSAFFRSHAVRAAAFLSLLCVIAGVATSFAAAQGTSAQAFVEAIYKPYLNKDFKGVPYSSAAGLRGYFEPKLANAMLKDMTAAAKGKEVGTLDGDPFIDAQDWEISNLAISVKTMGGDKASASVNFTNLGQPKSISLDLVKTRAGWRIADIVAPSGSLRQLFKVK